MGAATSYLLWALGCLLVAGSSLMEPQNWGLGASRLGLLPACRPFRGRTRGMGWPLFFLSLFKRNLPWSSFLGQNSTFLDVSFSLSPTWYSPQVLPGLGPETSLPSPPCFCSRMALLLSVWVHCNYTLSGDSALFPCHSHGLSVSPPSTDPVTSRLMLHRPQRESQALAYL